MTGNILRCSLPQNVILSWSNLLKLGVPYWKGAAEAQDNCLRPVLAIYSGLLIIADCPIALTGFYSDF